MNSTAINHYLVYFIDGDDIGIFSADTESDAISSAIFGLTEPVEAYMLAAMHLQKWILVGRAGLSSQYIHNHYATFTEASVACKLHGGSSDGFSVMKLSADGTLTTEF